MTWKGLVDTGLSLAKERSLRKCADCAFYKFIEGLTSEPLGGCENDEVLFPAVVMDYVGKNWRLNHRNSNTLRRCRGFKPRSGE